MAPDEKKQSDGQLSLFEDDLGLSGPGGKDVVVFDLETQRSFQDVGGRTGMRQLGLSVGVGASCLAVAFTPDLESEAGRLIDRLRSAQLVVGFNLLGFDYEVLKGYRDLALERTPTLDIMFDLQDKLGFRPKLDSVVQATLGAAKTADGLQALAWWKEGRLDLIEKYCTEVGRLTRDLYLYGQRYRHVLVTRFSGPPRKVAVTW